MIPEEPLNEISLSTSVFNKLQPEDPSFGQCLERAAQAGYKYVELSRRQNCIGVDVIRKSGLQVWSIHGCYLGPFMGSDAENQAALDAAIARVEMLAEFAPCPVVEHYLDRYNDPAYGVAFRKAVEKLYERYSALGFVLCIETAPYKPQINERYPDSAEIAAFVRSFQKNDLQMTVDINHSNLHEDLIQVMENCSGLVKNIHVSDNHGEWEDHLPPGQGIIDIKGAFEALRRNGYMGPCNLEFRFPGKTAATVTVEALKQVRLYMENLLWEKQ